ncbi:MAG TPA: hypothetical protein PKN21_11345 [Bacteroidales bacterium]|nr:hypothetical protein [Bacteroidales bacterium]
MWSRLKILRTRFTTLEYSPRYSRLAGELSCYKPQLEKRVMDLNAPGQQWAIQAKELLRDAERYLQQNKIDEGWKSFHAAQRLTICVMTDQELLAVAKSLFREAEKFNEWRKEAIINLLGKRPEGVTAIPTAEALTHASELRDEAYDNLFYLNRLVRNLFWMLCTLLFLTISGIVIYFIGIIGEMGKNYVTDLSLTGYLVGVLLFGLLGALTSAIVSTRQLTDSPRISELGSSQVITMSKIFIGAGFSVFIFLLLKSSLAKHIDIFSFNISQPLDYFAIAFASGFTERFAQKAINLLLGKEKPAEKKKENG